MRDRPPIAVCPPRWEVVAPRALARTGAANTPAGASLLICTPRFLNDGALGDRIVVKLSTMSTMRYSGEGLVRRPPTSMAVACKICPPKPMAGRTLSSPRNITTREAPPNNPCSCWKFCPPSPGDMECGGASTPALSGVTGGTLGAFWLRLLLADPLLPGRLTTAPGWAIVQLTANDESANLPRGRVSSAPYSLVAGYRAHAGCTPLARNSGVVATGYSHAASPARAGQPWPLMRGPGRRMIHRLDQYNATDHPARPPGLL